MSKLINESDPNISVVSFWNILFKKKQHHSHGELRY